MITAVDTEIPYNRNRNTFISILVLSYSGAQVISFSMQILIHILHNFF